ncbi:hypothetical protein AQUCO_00700553v1 [Aquilegia coerulea]|uniref:Uncharacterized protein n=1 Tax=Aquilegia coerulea TaxID=218851 RepID=A0A2G5EKP1_AQUCA|nr:hypothetical protein AQUCO_00700553v1 [Aquilegia coerulea]
MMFGCIQNLSQRHFIPLFLLNFHLPFDCNCNQSAYHEFLRSNVSPHSWSFCRCIDYLQQDHKRNCPMTQYFCKILYFNAAHIFMKLLY